MKITRQQLRRIIKEELAEALQENRVRSAVRRVLSEESAEGVEYIVGVDLPGTPGMGTVDKSQHRKNLIFRKSLEGKIGHKITLTGAHTANPNYKVEPSFATEQEANQLADVLSDIVSQAVDAGQLDYGSFMPEEVQQGKAGYVIDWDVAARGPFWG
jgi:hypothetical protein